MNISLARLRQSVPEVWEEQEKMLMGECGGIQYQSPSWNIYDNQEWPFFYQSSGPNGESSPPLITVIGSMSVTTGGSYSSRSDLFMEEISGILVRLRTVSIPFAGATPKMNSPAPFVGAGRIKTSI
jgi:hypothetical protein